MSDNKVDRLKEDIQGGFNHFKSLIKWIILGLMAGIIIGFVGLAFSKLIQSATTLRLYHPWLIFLLPFGGMLIIGCYMLFKVKKDQGTNLVLYAVQSKDNVPLNMAPLIFIGTIITHFFGGSAGREGAALQIGASIGNDMGRLFHMDSRDKQIMVMCGMSAGFAALFGTPLAGAVFALEVVSVGIMHYPALVPCVISAFTARSITSYFGVKALHYDILSTPAFNISSVLGTVLLAGLCAIISIIFCILLQKSETVSRKLFKNQYLRIFVGGCVIVGLTLLVGNQDYNGLGIYVIENALQGDVVIYAFALKILFTIITIGCGFKGGEIVPSIFIGATFGSAFGVLLGFDPTLCAAIGIGSVFCSVTNSPITSLLICFELFGFKPMPFFAIAIAISYMLSGRFGIYKTQRFVLSK